MRGKRRWASQVGLPWSNLKFRLIFNSLSHEFHLLEGCFWLFFFAALKNKPLLWKVNSISKGNWIHYQSCHKRFSN